MRLVLASASPRRRELLAQAGYEFEVRVAGVDESRREGEAPSEYVRRLALEKAAAVLAMTTPAAEMQIPSPRCGTTSKDGPRSHEAGHPAAKLVVLGADTTVVLDGEVMNKPRSREDAERMLRALSGRTHQVHTGVAVTVEAQIPFGNDNKTESSRYALTHVESTDVVFRSIAEDELRIYLDSGDALDKAGAYGIQGYAARWIPRIDGDYFNVVGLPIAAVVKLLSECRRSDAVKRDPDHVL